MLYFILSIFLLSWLFYIYLIIKERRLDGFYIKGFTSFVFIFLYAYCVYHLFLNSLIQINESVMVMVVAIGLALVLGLIGDLFLEVQYFHSKFKIKQIKYGMIFFGFGHLFYLAAITEMVSFNYFSLVIGLVMTLITYIGGKVLNLDFGKLKLYSYAYSFVIFTMVGQSIFQTIEMNISKFSLIFMIGAILFGISDLLLAPIYFKKETNKIFVVSNLGTYYLGQVLIAFSIYFLL